MCCCQHQELFQQLILSPQWAVRHAAYDALLQLLRHGDLANGILTLLPPALKVSPTSAVPEVIATVKAHLQKQPDAQVCNERPVRSSLATLLAGKTVLVCVWTLCRLRGEWGALLWLVAAVKARRSSQNHRCVETVCARLTPNKACSYSQGQPLMAAESAYDDALTCCLLHLSRKPACCRLLNAAGTSIVRPALPSNGKTAHAAAGSTRSKLWQQPRQQHNSSPAALLSRHHQQQPARCRRSQQQRAGATGAPDDFWSVSSSSNAGG
jgi:hypothetical protein